MSHQTHRTLTSVGTIFFWAKPAGEKGEASAWRQGWPALPSLHSGARDLTQLPKPLWRDVRTWGGRWATCRPTTDPEDVRSPMANDWLN